VKVSAPCLIAELIDGQLFLPEDQNLDRLERRRDRDNPMPLTQLAAY
jgi:hypothetical protein